MNKQAQVQAAFILKSSGLLGSDNEALNDGGRVSLAGLGGLLGIQPGRKMVENADRYYAELERMADRDFYASKTNAETDFRRRFKNLNPAAGRGVDLPEDWGIHRTSGHGYQYVPRWSRDPWRDQYLEDMSPNQKGLLSAIIKRQAEDIAGAKSIRDAALDAATKMRTSGKGKAGLAMLGLGGVGAFAGDRLGKGLFGAYGKPESKLDQLKAKLGL